MLDELKTAINPLQTASGAVCYSREAVDSEPCPIAAQAFNKVINLEFLITLSETKELRQTYQLLTILETLTWQKHKNSTQCAF